MTRSITLTIQDPCGQNWDEMKHSGNGRFCDSCQKTVVDFSRFSETEIIHYLRSHAGKTCGRIYEDQLNRPIQLPAQPRYVPIYRWVAGLLFFAIGSLQKSKAQIRSEKKDTTFNLSASPKAVIIRGRITDENGKAIPSVHVSLKNTSNSVSTDIAGEFNLPAGMINNNELIILEFTHPDHSMAEYQSLYLDLPDMIEVSITKKQVEAVENAEIKWDSQISPATSESGTKKQTRKLRRKYYRHQTMGCIQF